MSVKSLAFTYCPPFLRPTLERIENSPIGYRLAREVFWSMAGTVISRGLMLAASVLGCPNAGQDSLWRIGHVNDDNLKEMFAEEKSA